MRALVRFYSVLLLFWSNYVILQPCWFLYAIIYGLPGHFPPGIDRHNPMIGVHSFSYAADRRELAHILRSDIFNDIRSPIFLYSLSCAY